MKHKLNSIQRKMNKKTANVLVIMNRLRLNGYKWLKLDSYRKKINKLTNITNKL